jgi:hypothetical protein
LWSGLYLRCAVFPTCGLCPSLRFQILGTYVRSCLQVDGFGGAVHAHVRVYILRAAQPFRHTPVLTSRGAMALWWCGRRRLPTSPSEVPRACLPLTRLALAVQPVSKRCSSKPSDMVLTSAVLVVSSHSHHRSHTVLSSTVTSSTYAKPLDYHLVVDRRPLLAKTRHGAMSGERSFPVAWCGPRLDSHTQRGQFAGFQGT